jgi:autotransporter passenger strand-loop-strand repeat protein
MANTIQNGELIDDVVIENVSLTVLEGGTASNITVNVGGYLYVSAGGAATNIIENGGYVRCYDDAEVTFAANSFYGSVLSNNSATVHSGTTAKNMEIYSGGYLSISSGGVANNATVQSNGWINVNDGGLANNATAANGGRIYVYTGGKADLTTVNSGGSLYLGLAGYHPGGTATRTTVNSGGSMFISQGGTATSTTVNAGEMYLSSGGTAAYTTINKGRLIISSQGSADAVTVNPGGSLIVIDGKVTNIVENGGYVDIWNEAEMSVSYVSNTFSGQVQQATVHSGTTANNTIIGSHCGICLRGGLANETRIDSWGSFYVSSGGIANDTVNSIGQMFVYSGGYASNISLYGQEDRAEGDIYVLSGGLVADVTVEEYGDYYVSSGGTANKTTVNAKGTLEVSSGGTATNITENGGFVVVENGASVTFIENSFSELVLDNDSATVHSNTTANSIAVSSGGTLHVFSGGMANSTTVYGSGEYTVSSNGTANEVKVYAGGTLKIKSGGILTGKMSFLTGAVIMVENGTLVKFDLKQVSPGAKALLNDWSLIQGTPDYVITVKDDQETGVYKLADAADDFDGTITVKNSLGESLGTLTVGQTFNFKGINYSLNLESDGTLKVTLEKFGEVVTGTKEISSGMTSSVLFVLDGSYLIVSSGGTVSSTFVSSGGSMTVSSGGSAIDIHWTPFEGSVNIEAGAYVSFASQLSGVYYGSGMELLSHAEEIDLQTVNNTSMYVMPVGAANRTTVSAHGFVYVSGGVANSTLVNSSGSMFVLGGGVANSTTVNSEGALTVSNGGTANNAIVKGYGWLYVSNGGVANSTLMDNGGELHLFSGGTANDTRITAWGKVHVSSNGTANNTTVSSAGSLHISSGGTADHTTVYSGGITYVSSGGTATGTIMSGGSMYVSSGAMADGTIIAACSLTISSGGTGNSTTVGSGGRFYISNGATAEEIVENGGYVEVADGANYSFVRNTMNNLLLEYASATIHSGTTAVSTTINSGGSLYVFCDGVADSTTVNGGSMFISSGGTVDNTILNSGRLYISSGGTANNILWTPCKGRVYVQDGGIATFVSAYSGVYFGSNGLLLSQAAAMDDMDIASAYEMYVMSGGTANTATIRNWGNLTILNGGVANGTIMAGGYLEVSSGGVTNDTIVNNDNLFVSSGGIANNTIVNSFGYLTVSNGGLANGNIINSGGRLYVSGGIVSGTTVYVDGTFLVSSGGLVSNTKVFAGGRMDISSGAVITGKMNFLAGAIVLTKNGAIMNFDLSQASPGAKALLSDWSLIQGTPDYTLTIKDDQEMGIYKLAGSADEFDGTITVQNTLGKSLGTLAVGEKITIDEVDYSLNIMDDCLTVTVDNAAGVPPDTDTVAPTVPTGLMPVVDGQNVALLWNESTDDTGVKEYVVKYSLDGEVFTARTTIPHYVLKDADYGTWNWSVQAVDFAGNESAVTVGDAFTVTSFKPYKVEYSADNFEHAIRFAVTTPTLNTFRMSGGTYQMRVMAMDSSEWTEGDSIEASDFDDAPQLIKSDADGNADIFFANPIGTWESGYVAQHVGSINDWGGTNEYTAVFGKNKLADIFEGSTDANILLMTDDSNGDALFVDDIYTASPGNIAEKQSRIALIDEIRAGAGNDIVDMTSQQFEYIGDGLTIRGGSGNDTIWANKGDNWLFGDAGNDRIVGASGNDVIAGGIGNDRMHGGGGNDVFTFCDNWGVDNVEQLAGGSVTLWFAESESQITASELDGNSVFTNAAGTGSVTVKGFALADIVVKYGDDGSDDYAALASAGAFFDATSERIFEESGKGMLASL